MIAISFPVLSVAVATMLNIEDAFVQYIMAMVNQRNIPRSSGHTSCASKSCYMHIGFIFCFCICCEALFF